MSLISAFQRCAELFECRKLFLICSLALVISSESADAQIGQSRPSGCPGYWSGGSCICPDGSLAYGFPNITCGGGGGYQPPRPQGSYCSNGSICPPGSYCSWMPGRCVWEGDVDCGQYSCKQGGKCASGGRCIAEDEDDCGDGSSCRLGTVCWKPSEDVEGYKGGKTTCVASDERTSMEDKIVEQRKERKEQARKDKVEKEIAAHEKDSTSARERLEKNLAASEQERQKNELTNSVRGQQKSPALQQLEAMARGEYPPIQTTAGVSAPPAHNSSFYDAKHLRAGELRTVSAALAPSSQFPAQSFTGFQDAAFSPFDVRGLGSRPSAPGVMYSSEAGTKLGTISINALSAAGGALAPQTPAFELLKGASATADIVSAQQSGGSAGAWEAAYENVFVESAGVAGSAFGVPGRVAGTVTAQVSYDVGKHFIAPIAAPYGGAGLHWVDTQFGVSNDARYVRQQEATNALMELELARRN